MHLEGDYTFNAPRDAVWEALMDPDVLAQALPGGEGLTKTGDNQYRGIMNVRVGPVQGRFQGTMELSDITALERYTIAVNGQGTPGFMSGTGTLQLADSDGGTLMTYAGDVDVGGRIANVGQRLLESSARSLSRQALESLDRQIQARLAPPAPQATAVDGQAPHQAPPTPPAGPSMSRVAFQTTKDVAQDLASDYLSPANQERAVFFGLGALAMLLFVVLVRLVQDR